MGLTRRQFIKHAGLVTAASFVGPGLMRNPLVRTALADTIGDKFFVVVYLGGGNDGLNTLVPYDNGSFGTFRSFYEMQRTTSPSGGLQVLQSQLSDSVIGTDPHTGTPLALHPAFSGFKSLYDLGKVAIVQGCGYPEPVLSHVGSAQVWERADPLRTGLTTGWIGRYLAARYQATELVAFTTQDSVPGELVQPSTGILVVPRLADFTIPYDPFDPSDDAAKGTAQAALYAAARESVQPPVKYVGNVGSAVLRATKIYPALHDDYVADRSSWNALYDSAPGKTPQDLREVAKTIYGVLNGKVTSRFFEVGSGGYDTHSDQGAGEPSGKHSQLLAELGSSLQVFYEDCADMGIADKLCMVVWSEFGRRVLQNDNGSDHGTQCPMFVIGGRVNGGIYGNHPNIAPEALDPTVPNTVYSQAADDPHRSTDFRDVYGTLLKHWLEVSEADIHALIPVDVGDPSAYWTSPNFDLPFLP